MRSQNPGLDHLTLLGKGYAQLDGNAMAGPRLHGHRSTDCAGALLHAYQSESGGAWEGSAVKTDTVVPDRQAHATANRQPNRHVLRMGVPGDIVESLLCDAIHA